MVQLVCDWDENTRNGLAPYMIFFSNNNHRLKIFRFKERRWDPKQLLGSGGMPSSHSSTVTALAISIGLQDGFGGQLFAVASILACVVSS